MTLNNLVRCLCMGFVQCSVTYVAVYGYANRLSKMTTEAKHLQKVPPNTLDTLLLTSRHPTLEKISLQIRQFLYLGPYSLISLGDMK